VIDPSWTRERVVATVAEQFPPDLRTAVLSALDEYLGDTPAGRARVQLAVLKIAEGDIKRVQELAGHATVDFRDILYTADLKRPGVGRPGGGPDQLPNGR
jgi:hypothetical protein